MLSMPLHQCFSGSMPIVTFYSNTVPQQRQWLSVLFSSHNSNEFVKQRLNQPINGEYRKKSQLQTTTNQLSSKHCTQRLGSVLLLGKRIAIASKENLQRNLQSCLAFRMLQCIRINTPHGVVLRNGQQSFQSGSNELQQMKKPHHHQ